MNARSGMTAARGRSERRIPILPVLSTQDFGRSIAAETPGVLQVGEPILVTRGSVAIRLALEHAGIGQTHSVLLPAFHCPSMLEPVIHSGARPAFYGVTEDLLVTPDEIRKRLAPDTRAVLIPHFFARLQDLRELRALCDSRGIRLIEDCAHALFGTVAGQHVGTTGHYAIASPRKFFPLSEGGLLTSATLSLDGVRVQRTPLLRSARRVFDVVDIAVSHGRLGGLAPVVRAAKAVRHGLHGAPADASLTQNMDSPDGTADHAAPPNECADWTTRAALPRLLTAEMLRKRRANYARLAAGLADTPALSVLFPDLGADTVPYMLPVLLSQPERQFAECHEHRMPIWRWEYSQRGHCAVTDRYAQALVQVPCHQSLLPEEIEWMIATLRRIGRRES